MTEQTERLIAEMEIEKKERASKRASNITVTKDMVQYWLDDNYQNWIADVLVALVNDKNANALPNLQKEIKDAWEQRSEVN